MSEFCIVNTHDLRVYTFCTPENAPAAIERANASNRSDIERCLALIDAPCNADGYFSRRLQEYRERDGRYVGMSFEIFQRMERERFLSLPLHEITEDRYHEMLNVLPPLKWTRRNGVEMFCMSEMYSGTYTDQYAHDHNTGKYYAKLVDLCDETTWIHNYL